MSDIDEDVYRSCKTSSWPGHSEDARRESFEGADGAQSLYPDYSGYVRKDGAVRAPDVTRFNDGAGHFWIRGVDDRSPDGRALINWKEGVSLSTVRGGFGYRGWFYFLLPAGTPVPAGLDVVATPTRNDTGHHSIRCKAAMRQDAYEGALNNLARSAIAKAVELGRASLYFS